MVPTLDISPPLGGGGSSRDGVDAAIIAVASGTGFMVVTGLPGDTDLSAADRADFLRIFARRVEPRPEHL